MYRSSNTVRMSVGAVLLLCASHVLADQSSRQKLSFDADWRFHLGEVTDGQRSAFDDANWRTVQLPHDYSIEQPHDPQMPSSNGFLPGGIGWYRKTFNAPSEWQDKKIFIRFDAVMRNSDVWINDTHLGHRPYGYVGFRYDLTPHLKFGQKNVIAVRCDRENPADSRWYAGAGIYRRVWIEVTNPVRVADTGVYITTPQVSPATADVQIAYEIANDSGSKIDLRIESRIASPNAQSITSGEIKVSHTDRQTMPKLTLEVPKPRLWSPDTPELYTLHTRVYANQKLVDELSTPFGIRFFRFDPQKGFFLNGKNMLLKGVCIHHDVPAVGGAVPAAMWERRLHILKETGVNAIRMSHNPMAPELYEMCDRLGFLVQDELFDEWIIGKRKWVTGWNVGEAKRFGYSNYFDEWHLRDARDIVRQNRNHPSIIMWSIGNEIDFPDDPTVHPKGRYGYDEGKPKAELLVPIAKRLIETVKAEDDTRPVTMALADIGASNATGLADLLDVVGYNYQEQHYARDHAQYPERVIYGSENGLGDSAWLAVRDNEYISAQFLWIGFAYLGEARTFPARGWLGGLFDFCGYPRPSGDIRKVFWSDKPAVAAQVMQLKEAGNEPDAWRLDRTVRHWTIGVDHGMPIRVRVYSNTEEVELFLNGKSLGSRSMEPKDNYRQFWRVPYEPGELKVVGRNRDGATAEYSLYTFGPAKRIVLKVEEDQIKADGLDVAHVRAYVVDERGIRVHDADVTLSLKVNGPGRLIGFDNGNPRDVDSTLTNDRAVFEGRALAYIQSIGKPGQVQVTASAEGLESATMSFNTKGQ